MRAIVLVAAISVSVLISIPTALGHERGVTFDAAAEAGLWPGHDEVQAHIDRVAEHPGATVHTVGQSGSGKAIRLVAVTDPTSHVPMEERVVTLLLTQQHGNEPAGTPAALAVLDRLLDGDLAPLLSNQVVLVLPMANPDGATKNIRENLDGEDINRDHVDLSTAEGRAIHHVLTTWDVHVALDHHEYSGTGVGHPFPVRTYDYDLTSLFPRHGNVRGPTLEAAQSLMYDAIWPHAQEQGYSTGEYGMQTVAGIPVQQVAGGPDPGILRNSFGLYNVAGLLIETFVGAVDHPLHDAERRTDIHVTTMEATLQHAHDHAAALRGAKAASAQANLNDYPPQYVEGDTQVQLAKAYASTEDLDALMALHGLPAALALDGKQVYDLRHDRPGLAAAILHPDSSRSVVAGVPFDAGLIPADADLQQKESPVPVAAALAAVLAIALVRRRR